MRLLSKSSAKALAILLANPEKPKYGYEIMKEAGLAASTLYPALARFEGLGWLSRSEMPGQGGRPPRQMYLLQHDAISEAQAELNRYIDIKGREAVEPFLTPD